jgi:hypothetical protein
MKSPASILSAVILFTAARAYGAELVFSAYLTTNRSTRFVLTDPSSGNRSGWLTIGESFNGRSLVSFVPELEVLHVRGDGDIEQLPLHRESVYKLPAPSDAALEFVDRLAISGAAPSSATRSVGLIYIYQGDRFAVVPVGRFVSAQLGIKVHSITNEPGGVVVVFEEKPGVLISRSLAEKTSSKASTTMER